MVLRHWIIMALIGLTLGASQYVTSAAYADLATDAAALPDRSIGKADAPVTIIEYASLTCNHCAQFQNDTLEKLKANYIDTGKARLIFRDFPIDGIALRVAAVARCMPEASYHPFISILYKNQAAWIKPEVEDKVKAATQYAKLGGLNDADAKACAANEKLLDAIVAAKTHATEKYKIESTPTFVFNDGAEVLSGARPYEDFVKILDRLLAEAKKK
ncbi:MAG: DsbA family protein [Alphaproteobacteria bacterium]